MDRNEVSHGYWSGRAPEYSELHEREYASARGRALGEVMRRLVCDVAARLRVATAGVGTETEVEAPARVRALDLGCGSGLLSILLAQAGCDVTGIDFSEDMLMQARANAERHQVSDLTGFRQGDVHDLPFEDDTFDLVVTRNVTWVLEDVPRVYAEALRVLRPGGTFVNIDANYGQAFRAADLRGEVPTHPTQTLEQLRTRNAITVTLPISFVDRPSWDVETLRMLGASTVTCNDDFEGTLSTLAALMGDLAGGSSPARSGSDQAPEGDASADAERARDFNAGCPHGPDSVANGTAFGAASASTRARLFMVTAGK